MKFVLSIDTIREDVLDTIDCSMVNYMGQKRQIDESAMRKLLKTDPEVWSSYMRKVNRVIAAFIRDGVPASFFGK